MTPALCRAARGYLGWSQNDLADKAQVGRSTVVTYEVNGERTVTRASLACIKRAFEDEGISFEINTAGSWHGMYVELAA